MDANRQPVAQKKHQMYGKRFAHESSVLPPPALHPHSNIGTDLSSIPNVPLKYEPYEPYAVSSNLDGAAASSSSVIKPPSSMMDSEMKYSYSLDFPLNRHLKSGSNGLASHELINHNHTYTMPHPGPLNSSGATPRPQTRDKKVKKSEEEHMTRDEKRARALHIPISVSFPVSNEGLRVRRHFCD
jgi:nuclear factor erythroid 2, invertebrate